MTVGKKKVSSKRVSVEKYSIQTRKITLTVTDKKIMQRFHKYARTSHITTTVSYAIQNASICKTPKL